MVQHQITPLWSSVPKLYPQQAVQPKCVYITREIETYTDKKKYSAGLCLEGHYLHSTVNVVQCF